MDRNVIANTVIFCIMGSLSARRAWIEIRTRSQPSKPKDVALRKESVDRNECSKPAEQTKALSLSARRAWIEIGIAWVQEFPKLVALRKESVDRNFGVPSGSGGLLRRSPQGERG